MNEEDQKFAVLKKTVLSKPRTPKEIVTEKAAKRRQKRKAELQKALSENDRKWQMIKNSEKKAKKTTTSTNQQNIVNSIK